MVLRSCSPPRLAVLRELLAAKESGLSHFLEHNVRVMVCCNDERGDATGFVERVDFEDADGYRAALAGPSIRFRRVVVGPYGATYRIGRRLFHALVTQRMVGNVFWDAVKMKLPESVALLRYLLDRGYQAEDWTTSGPFAEVLSQPQPAAEETR